MAAQIGFFQRMFRAAMGTRGLHATKLTLSETTSDKGSGVSDGKVNPRSKPGVLSEFSEQFRIATGLMLSL
jgi:hypothetical protein